MGVTTAVGGNCGINVYDPVKYLDMVEKDGAPVNVMLFAGHQYFREAAGALDKYAPVTKEQQEHMKKGLEKALEAGWDMFKNYEERGRVFKECVMAL